MPLNLRFQVYFHNFVQEYVNFYCRSFRGFGQARYCNVVIDSGSPIMAGFSVVDFGEFAYHLRQLLEEGRFRPDLIPDCTTRQRNAN